MALNFNGTEPLTIKVIKGGTTTNLNILKYGTTAVWGKAYTLTIDRGEHTIVNIQRQTSPNQHANGTILHNGSLVYYGDTIKVDVNAESGYQLDNFTINGINVQSGIIITISKNIHIQTKAVASQQWHTMWTGSEQMTVTTSKAYDVLISGVPTRLTGTFNVSATFPLGGGSREFSGTEISSSSTTLASVLIRNRETGKPAGTSSASAYISGKTISYSIAKKPVSVRPTLTITKIEQYF